MDRNARKRKAKNDLDERDHVKKIRALIRTTLQKEKSSLTQEEKLLLKNYPDIKNQIQKTLTSRQKALSRKRNRESERSDSSSEVDDSSNLIAEALYSCKLLAKKVLVYTGAGISTSANISDYRGEKGVWTRLNRNEDISQSFENRKSSLTHAKPTKTHMILKNLVSNNYVCHVLSQNCDGLHIRSGISKERLSEIHGNMYAERCSNCHEDCSVTYRIFDVTDKTGFRRHKTDRQCSRCDGELFDTIVHFGEKNPENCRYPYNWKGVYKHLEKTEDLGCIICIGTSCKVLEAYKHLWPKETQLFIINLQWTPKDSLATKKIHAKSDEFMDLVYTRLKILDPELEKYKLKYEKKDDQLLNIALPVKRAFLPTIKTLSFIDETDNTKFKKELSHISLLKNPVIQPAWYGIGLKKKK